MLSILGFSPVFWGISFVIQAILKQLDKWGDEHDWKKTKMYLEEKVSLWLPGQFFDGVAVDIALTLVDALQVLTQAGKPLQEIIEDIVKKDWKEALKDIATLLEAIGKEVAPGAGELADKLRKSAG